MLILAGSLWLLGEGEREEAVREIGPRLRSVDLDALRRQALDRLTDRLLALSGFDADRPAKSNGG